MIRRALVPLFALLFALSPVLAQTAPKKPATAGKGAARSKAAIPQPFAVPATDEPPSLSAASYILLDAATGQVLHEHNADQVRPVASTQKLLTALVIAEDGSLEGSVRVQASDTWAEPSKLYLKPGEVYPRYKLLQILLIKSMNDVARCLARDHAGSVEAFAQRMNAKAASLGMRNSHFVNPNGLPAPGQHSTARDMAKVAMAAYRNRTIRSIVCQKSFTWTYNDGRTKTFSNTNQVLRNYAPCNGMKTGYTEASGFCLISSAAYGGREVIAVVLGDSRAIWTDSHRLLNWGLSS